MAEVSLESTSDNSVSKALRNAAFAVLLLASLTPVRPLAFIAAIAVGFVYALRRILRFNRPLGLTVIGSVASATCVYLFLLYSVEQRHQSLLTRLTEYSEVSVRRNLFPLPYVHQLSIGHGVTDDQLSAILKLDGLDRITDLYLENGNLTDTCLDDVAAIPKLGYVFIDCDGITDNAILTFEQRLPDCSVIPYQRHLHGEPTVFLGMPPDGGYPSDAAEQ